MKKLPIFLCSALLMSMPTCADTIAGMNIDIPKEWTLVESNPSDDGSLTTNIYSSSENEFVIAVVQDVKFLSDDMKAIADLYLFDCEQIYKENEGFYLMTDTTEEIDGLAYKMQECVFMDGDAWDYALLGSRNRGDYVVTLIYQASTMSVRDSFQDFVDLYNTYIVD